MGQVSVGIIPARAGSKRVPGKNLADLGGIPLVEWTIRAAQKSRLSKTVVSTEDDAIAETAFRAGADIVRRPAKLAEDHVWSAPVVIHALDVMKTRGFEPEYVCLLHPTSPFRTDYDIDRCLAMADMWPGSVISFTNDDLNGAIYIARVRDFLRDGSFFKQAILPYDMGAVTGMDIDFPEDLQRARDYVDKCRAA